MVRLAHGQPRATTSRYRSGSTGQPSRPSAVIRPSRYVVSRLNAPLFSLMEPNLGRRAAARDPGCRALAEAVEEFP